MSDQTAIGDARLVLVPCAKNPSHCQFCARMAAYQTFAIQLEKGVPRNSEAAARLMRNVLFGQLLSNN